MKIEGAASVLSTLKDNFVPNQKLDSKAVWIINGYSTSGIRLHYLLKIQVDSILYSIMTY